MIKKNSLTINGSNTKKLTEKSHVENALFNQIFYINNFKLNFAEQTIFV